MFIVVKRSPISATAEHLYKRLPKHVLPYAIGWLSVCLSDLCVTLVYCGRTVGWIKMKLATEVGLGPSDIM